ncbi:MAG: glycosyltransferase [Candidatus Polarisedimenticolaceae bacterium]|nr:glycosyltransferase [Candidatus Polarisedimenticolaceae bacterium]
MMKLNSVVIGLYLHDDQDQLQATLNSIMEHTIMPFEIVLLADGPTPPLISALRHYPRIKRIINRKQRGAAACFNNLCKHVDAPLYAFIESGTLLGPNWLIRLNEALQADPSHGLAGPSTNHCWNEQHQQAFNTKRDCDLKSTTEQLAHQYGQAWQTLGPLHSLASFCYLVKREVIDAIGAADESYSNGPGWEMDYNIRAARAGYRGVWVKGAYAHRLPLTPKHLTQEQAGIVKAKQIYQDRFCHLRVEQPNHPYSDHCKGDECPHFANTSPTERTLAPSPKDNVVLQLSNASITPMVSCVMPTSKRPHWVAKAIEQFHKQDYPKKELIIVYDHDDDIQPLSSAPSIRYLHATEGRSIGAKRQQGAAIAKGSIIAQWDDDDWYAITRLSHQAAPIHLNIADITGLTNTLFFELNRWRFWQCSQALYSKLFHQQVAGGTLVYRKSLLDESSGYPNLSLREDAAFLDAALQHGARLSRVEGRELFIYLRHGDNSWRFTEGHYLTPQAWSEVDEPACFQDDREHYMTHTLPITNETYRATENETTQPMVSCIMPTANRPHFASRAIQLFLEQDYPNKELIIIDDGDKPIGELITDDPCIRYQHNSQRQSIGAKRNQACEIANGSIIVHWDDDDWMATSWLRLQVNNLLTHLADISGLANVLFYEPHTRQAWQYRYDGHRPWVCGGTLCYKRSYWENNPFLDISTGEDNAFVWSNTPKKVINHNSVEQYIATVHEKNTSPKQTTDPRWHPYPADRIKQLLTVDRESTTPLESERSAHS